MRVAVALFGQEVSPRFGCTSQMLLATVGEGGVQVEGVRDLRGLAPWQWPELLSSLGVEKVVCGGVHRQFLTEMERHGLEVIWGVIGPADEALAALHKGTLRSDGFVCPGRRRHRRGWGRPGQQGRGARAGGGAGRPGHGPAKGPG